MKNLRYRYHRKQEIYIKRMWYYRNYIRMPEQRNMLFPSRKHASCNYRKTENRTETSVVFGKTERTGKTDQTTLTFARAVHES